MLHTLSVTCSIEEVLADSDSDLEDDGKQRNSKETRKALRQRAQAWLKEGEGDEPLNFLDPHVAHRVLGKDRTGTAGLLEAFIRRILGWQDEGRTCIRGGDSGLDVQLPHKAFTVSGCFFPAATKPGTSKVGKVSHDFKVSADGRLIICEEEEKEEEETKGM